MNVFKIILMILAVLLALSFVIFTMYIIYSYIYWDIKERRDQE